MPIIKGDIEFLNVEEVEEMLGVSDKTLRKYRADGRLKSRRIGRNIMFKAADIKEFLQGADAPAEAEKASTA